MARIRDIVLDCHHPAALARFWAATLEGYQVAPYDVEELQRLRGIGIESPEDDPSVLVEPVSGEGVRLFVQRVPEPKTVKNRMHLDLEVDAAALDPELERLVSLGAAVLDRRDDWVVLADPEGHEFCIEPV